MADDIKKDSDNKDLESGRPVQLDREEQDGKMKQDKDKQHDKHEDKQAAEKH